MEGRKLKFLLQQIGLTYVQFGKMTEKSESTVRRWTEQKHVGVIYEIMLEEFIGKKRFAVIEKEWVQLEKAREQRIQEIKDRQERKRQEEQQQENERIEKKRLKMEEKLKSAEN